MKKKQETETPDVSVESLKNEIRQYHREQVLALLDRKVLSQVPENEKTEIYRLLTSLTNPAIMDYIVKDAGTLSADALSIDFSNLRNREFVAEMLKKHRKNLDLTSADKVMAYLHLACEINDDDTVRFLLKRKGGVSDLTPLADMNAEAFGSVVSSCRGQISGTQAADLVIAVCGSDETAEKLRAMAAAGYDLNAKGKDGKSALEIVRERVREGKYKNTKEGNQARARDRQTLKVLDPKPVEKDPETEKHDKRKRTLTALICAAVCVAVVLIIVIGNLPKKSASDTAADSAAVSTESGAESVASTAESAASLASSDEAAASSGASAETTAASGTAGSTAE